MSVRVRILPREIGRFPEGAGRTRLKCVGDYACHLDPPGVAGSSGRILEVVSACQFGFVQKLREGKLLLLYNASYNL
ncbi:hypothetical protein DV702_07550 [Sporosarcina sp. PTS2304]|nr:hypothetical protein DV702_07550 [Sporosarcina sp. PTS2304]